MLSQNPPEQEILIVYGTLAPGRQNYSIVEPFGGQWSKAWVRGRIQQDQGYPVFINDPQAPELELDILISSHIDWIALDCFEGKNYRRISVPFRSGTKILQGNIYAWAKNG